MTHQQHEICQICPSRDTVDGFFDTLHKRRYDSKTAFWPLFSSEPQLRTLFVVEHIRRSSGQKVVLESYLRLGRVPKNRQLCLLMGKFDIFRVVDGSSMMSIDEQSSTFSCG